METQAIRANGLVFTVDVAGPADGVPVLLLHGFPQSRHTWGRQLPALAEAGYRAIAPDQRGYSSGARPVGTEHYATAHIVEDALALMDAAGAERFHLIGHNWGGQIAWSAAMRAPERVRSLTILSRPHPAAFAEAWANDPGQPARSGHHKTLLLPETVTALRAAGLTPLKAMFRGAAMPEANAENYIRVLSEPGALEAAIEWYRAAAGGLRAADAPKITVPTLYIWGEEDGTVGRYAAEATSRCVDAPYRFLPIAGGGHFLTDQMPDTINAAILQHLAAFP